MRAPNSAEMILPPPIPETDIGQQQAVTPNAVNAPQAERRGTLRIASALLVTTALAGLAPAANASAEHHSSETVRATATVPGTYAANNMRPVAYERAGSIYSGSITIQAPRSTRPTRKLQAPSATENDGVLIAKQMGISPERVTQGKKTEVTIAGVRVDLADYRGGPRKAEAWNTSKDCAWNWAKQDIVVAGKTAGLAEDKIKQTVNNKNIKRVMRGYFEDNSKLKNDPDHFLTTGVGYVAKHARAEADELVGAMRAAQAKPAQKPNPDTKAQPQPDYQAKHAAPETTHTPTKWERFKKVATPTAWVGGVILGIAGVAAGAMAGYGRYRRRRRNEGDVTPVGKHHHSPPNPGGGSPLPADDFSDLREITNKDKERDYDSIDPPTGAHAAGGLGTSPFAPPAGERAFSENSSEKQGPTDIRARFGKPRLIDAPITERHLRPVPDSPADTAAKIQMAFAKAQTSSTSFGQARPTPESNMIDKPTDPEGGRVFPMRRPPTQGRGKQPNGDYIGVHRRAEPVVSRVPVHRPAFAATDIPEPAAV